MEHAHHARPKLCDDILSLPPLDEEGPLSDPTSLDPIFTLPSALPDVSSFESAPDAGLDLESSPSRPRHHQRLSGDAVRTLKAWLKSHPDNPYPTAQEKDDLGQRTGLSRTQISNWFINARRRKRSSGYMAVPQPQSLLSPMERWRHSPPESEAAATDDILRALADPDIPAFPGSSPYAVPQYAWSSNDSSGSFILGGPSSSCGHSQSSSEISVALSHRPPPRPPTPMHRPQPRRRHRQRHIRHANRLQEARRPYQCTFCADTFATKYDWQRHEKALHLPVDQWRCAPDGGLIDNNGTPMCIFCQEVGADEDHLEKAHNYSICCERPAEQRMFTRKDHLRQHLKLTHHVDSLHSVMTTWRETRSELVSRCGFCHATFQTWPERVDHVAEHFKQGSDMKQWTGDWGFAPDVQRLVENAIPPYLVGTEWHTPDPWRTSNVLGMPGDEDDEIPFQWDVPNALSRYFNVHSDLLAYIRDQLAAGMRPSDQMIQDRARVFAYESDDPWNQTYADDPFWLEAVKQEAGLIE